MNLTNEEKLKLVEINTPDLIMLFYAGVYEEVDTVYKLFLSKMGCDLNGLRMVVSNNKKVVVHNLERKFEIIEEFILQRKLNLSQLRILFPFSSDNVRKIEFFLEICPEMRTFSCNLDYFFTTYWRDVNSSAIPAVKNLRLFLLYRMLTVAEAKTFDIEESALAYKLYLLKLINELTPEIMENCLQGKSEKLRELMKKVTDEHIVHKRCIIEENIGDIFFEQFSVLLNQSNTRHNIVDYILFGLSSYNDMEMFFKKISQGNLDAIVTDLQKFNSNTSSQSTVTQTILEDFSGEIMTKDEIETFLLKYIEQTLEDYPDNYLFVADMLYFIRENILSLDNATILIRDPKKLQIFLNNTHLIKYLNCKNAWEYFNESMRYYHLIDTDYFVKHLVVFLDLRYIRLEQVKSMTRRDVFLIDIAFYFILDDLMNLRETLDYIRSHSYKAYKLFANLTEKDIASIKQFSSTISLLENLWLSQKDLNDFMCLLTMRDCVKIKEFVNAMVIPNNPSSSSTAKRQRDSNQRVNYLQFVMNANLLTKDEALGYSVEEAFQLRIIFCAICLNIVDLDNAIFMFPEENSRSCLLFKKIIPVNFEALKSSKNCAWLRNPEFLRVLEENPELKEVIINLSKEEFVEFEDSLVSGNHEEAQEMLVKCKVKHGRIT